MSDDNAIYGVLLLICKPVKYVPEWFPGAGFKRQASLWKKHVDAMADVPFELAKVGPSSAVGTISADRAVESS